MDELRRREALAEFEPKLRGIKEIPRGEDQIKLYEVVADKIGREVPIRYLEFGVFDGTSMRKMNRIFTNPESEFIGFDSFVGLPEDWHDFKTGKFTRDGAAPVVSDSRVRFVKGWFQNSVPDFLATLHARPNKITLVHFDADLYSASLFLLSACWFNIPEYYFIFDEYFIDEVIALHDFTVAFPVELEFFGKTIGPMQVAGRLRRTALTL